MQVIDHPSSAHYFKRMEDRSWLTWYVHRAGHGLPAHIINGVNADAQLLLDRGKSPGHICPIAHRKLARWKELYGIKQAAAVPATSDF